MASAIGVTLADTMAAVALLAVLETQDQAAAVRNTASGWQTTLFALMDGTTVGVAAWFMGGYAPIRGIPHLQSALTQPQELPG